MFQNSKKISKQLLIYQPITAQNNDWLKDGGNKIWIWNCYLNFALEIEFLVFYLFILKICLFVYLFIYFLFRWESSHRPANVRLARMADIPGLYPSKKCWGGKNIRYGFCLIQNASAPCHQIWIWRLESLGWYPCYCTLKGKNQWLKVEKI